MICNYWSECDTEQGRVFEYCKAARRVASCSGMVLRCDENLKRVQKDEEDLYETITD